jgi:hypothetical protein
VAKIQKGGAVSRVLSSTPTITAGAYSANDLVGGKISLTPAARLVSLPSNIIPTATIINVILTDKSTQASNTDVIFWSADPSATTFTDNAALTVADADLLNIIGIVTVNSWTTFAANSVGTTTSAVTFPYQLASEASTLYASLITRGTPTYASTSDLTLRVQMYWD